MINIDRISYISNSLQDELDIFRIYFWEFYLHEVKFFLLILHNKDLLQEIILTDEQNSSTENSCSI